jgi:hypothetical protein
MSRRVCPRIESRHLGSSFSILKIGMTIEISGILTSILYKYIKIFDIEA